MNSSVDSHRRTSRPSIRDSGDGGTEEHPRTGRVGEISSVGLSAADFTRIAVNGFGDPQNAYCHAMAAFQDHVYVGTTRHSMALLKLFPPLEEPVMDPWPVRTPERVDDLEMQGQIWRWDLAGERWENVHTSPLIPGRNGKEVPRDLGYRGMEVFQGRSDPEPALYVASMSTVLRGDAARILRSLDGVTFSPVSAPGLGNPNVSTFRAMVAFDGHLFIPPTGEGTSFNSNRASVILRSSDPLEGVWEVACEPGFGDSTNNGIFELAVFDGHLYAGTFNQYQGYQVWKTPATGDAPCCWTKVIERGAGRGNLNEIAMSLCPFDDALYVGSAIQNGGYDRTNQVGPAAGELIRIYPDDSWELVVGTPRRAPDGMKYPLSGMGPGFDNVFAGYMWRMVVHEGWLYASTFDWSVFLPYAGRPSRTARRMMRELGVEHIVRHGGGFELWRSRNGTDWVPVTQNGLGNPYNYGARNMVSTPQGLFLGTANPFGPEVAAQIAGDWIYVPNPHGGAEVWLGRSPADRVSPEPAETPRARRKKGPTSPPVLLTGATGLIGPHVLERLLARGDRVRVLALPETVGDVGHRDRVEIVTGDLAEAAALEEAVRGVEVVYHLAALLPGSPPAELRAVNVGGTENLLRACGQVGGVRRLVFTSSTAVYAGTHSPEEWPLKETSRLGARGPESLRSYGRSKVAAETLVQRYASDFGFEYVILRPTMCYGVGSEDWEALVRWVCSRPLAGAGALEGRMMQPVHVRDLAEAIVLVSAHPQSANEIFNVAGAETFAYPTIATMIRQIAGRAEWGSLRPDRSRIWQRYAYVFDTAKARRRLGFIPRVMMQEGLDELVAAVETQNADRSSRDGRHLGWWGAPPWTLAPRPRYAPERANVLSEVFEQ